MKKFTYLFAAFLFLASCTSVNKLVERGDYHGAILLAINKLEGKKNKKTKHVQGLEEAFAKMNEKDIRIAKHLLNQNRASNWDDIFDIYSAINKRQESIEPLLPLVSKDGYRAKFTFINVSTLLNEAAEKAAAYEYKKGNEFLELGKKGDKESARRAHTHFLNTKRYFNDYKSSRSLAKTALYHGKTRVLVTVKNKSNAIMPAAFEREVLDIHVRDLNTKWTEYYVRKTIHPIDVKAVLRIEEMDISPEREVVNNFENSKRVKDGWEYVLDSKGNVKKDTLGNDIKRDVFRTVHARITEIHRTKEAFVRGKVVYFDNYTGERFKSQAVNVTAVFDDFACQFSGDKRALQDKYRKRLKKYPAPFPSDFQITMDAAENLKDALKTEIDRAII